MRSNAAFHLRLLRGVMVDDLRLQRWNEMITSTFKRASAHSSQPEEWFTQQLATTLQRLLQGIRWQKAGTFFSFWRLGLSDLTIDTSL